ncbi:HAMP domain-containing histidine kinase [Paenibacillus rhizovicinus]|uniref:histidine kinase n=1 Tax=Paenibacillus rhizovicinus TaxID=2704463 RepID=A0A6C0NTY2_9BACL|nr:HAMP domain-containing sensor histidine kinase [Paenibacillus rhizovicinus]QHW29581.1 HAMP domain-containing histidine kinase [Paenibacillus rhizovicinus]
MFNNVRRRLVVLNAAVILLALTMLSSLIYFHMHYRLYHDTDEILKMAERRVQSFQNLPEMLRTGRSDPNQDETTTYLFWNAEGNLIGQLPVQSFSPDITYHFKLSSTTSELRTVNADKRTYRVLQFPAMQKQETIVSIGIVRSLEDAKSTLHSLMWDISLAIIAGVVISIFSGIFLAGRALVPIRNSWENQQRFVADASHELRTPTAVILAQTELLLRHPSHSIEQESPHIAVILKESKRMNRLLSDLLTLARTDSNQLQLQRSVIALDVVLQELIEHFRLLSVTKEIDIGSDLQTPLSLVGDEGRIRQLLIILLDNALKFTPPYGHIEIIGRYRSDFVYICVKDNGCGIAEADLPYVFDRFYRGDKARSRAEGGTGLGLSIAKWIVNAHGGMIRIDSTVNLGTSVELFLPRK